MKSIFPSEGVPARLPFSNLQSFMSSRVEGSRLNEFSWPTKGVQVGMLFAVAFSQGNVAAVCGECGYYADKTWYLVNHDKRQSIRIESQTSAGISLWGSHADQLHEMAADR
jgi:hypothetical protein